MADKYNKTNIWRKGKRIKVRFKGKFIDDNKIVLKFSDGTDIHIWKDRGVQELQELLDQISENYYIIPPLTIKLFDNGALEIRKEPIKVHEGLVNERASDMMREIFLALIFMGIIIKL